MRSILPYATKFAFKLALTVGILTAGLVTNFSPSAQAEEIFGNNGIKFDVDTIVEFEFVESHGAYQSSFGVINLDTGEKTPLLVEVKPSDRSQDVNNPSTGTDDSGQSDDFLGTPGNAVPNPLAEFQFKANTRYAFYLESTFRGSPSGILYSINSANPGGNQQVRFQGDFIGLANGGILIRWDDTGSVLVRTDKEDRDFDDFLIRSGGRLACPYDQDTSSNKQVKGQRYELAKNLEPSSDCNPVVKPK